MVQANKLVVVTDDATLPPPLSDFRIVERVELRHCTLLVLNEPPSSELDLRLGLAGFCRLFENFCFRINNDSKDRERILGDFFSYLANDYDEHTHGEQNVRCYDFLLDFARDLHLVDSPRVLDYGCGTGTVLSSRITETAASIIGFDISDKIEQIAAARGLMVWNEEALLQCPNEHFDLIVAAYVLHYGISENRVVHLLDCLAPGGIFVANHHKGYGIQHTKTVVSGLTASDFDISWRESSFGACLAIRKH